MNKEEGMTEKELRSLGMEGHYASLVAPEITTQGAVKSILIVVSACQSCQVYSSPAINSLVF